MSALPDESWDRDLAQLDGHFLQTRAWMRFQLAQGRQIAWDRQSDWMWSGSKVSVGPFSYLYLPYGPVGSLSGALPAAVSAARALNVDALRIEPTDGNVASVVALGGSEVRARQPKLTWRLNLHPNVDELRGGLTKGHKGSINSASRKDLVVSMSWDLRDIDEMIRLIHATEARVGFVTHPDDYFVTMLQTLLPSSHACLYFAQHDGQRVAGAIAFDSPNTRYYAHAGAMPAARQLSPAAPLVWQMVLDAKASGQSWFDFWGIAPGDDPDHPWAGISQFKRSFGGQEMQRLGTWDLPIRSLRYRAFRWARKMRG